MRYFVTIGPRTFEVDLSDDTPLVDGEPLEVSLTRLADTPTLHLMADGRSHTLTSRREDGSYWDLHLDGERLRAEVVDERTHAIAAMTGQGPAARGPGPVRAPMPGMVVRVLVAPGDQVKAGQSVVIIEAMKMENDLKAEADGVVSEVTVEAGNAVEKGAILVRLRAEEEGG